MQRREIRVPAPGDPEKKSDGDKITGKNDFAYSRKIIWTKGPKKLVKLPSSQYQYEDLALVEANLEAPEALFLKGRALTMASKEPYY